MKESRKTQYTKKVIKDSLLDLLRQKALPKITVKELCELADINRSTFYSHYSDVYDLVEGLQQQLSDAVLENIDMETIKEGNQLELFERIFTIMKGIEAELELVYLYPDSIRFIHQMIDRVSDYATRVLEEKYPQLSQGEVKHIFNFISHGCCEMTVSWVESGMKESPKEMAALMKKTLMGEYYY